MYLIPIPAASTGYLIGKNGETIKSLQVDSGARISVSNDPHGLDTHLKNVVIEGPKEAINKAKELIQNLMESFHKIKKEKDILEDNEASKVEITVPTNCLGILIGIKYFKILKVIINKLFQIRKRRREYQKTQP